MAYKSTRGKTGGGPGTGNASKLTQVDNSRRTVLGQGIGGGGGAASSPLTNPIYSITISSAPGPSGDQGTTVDLLEEADYAKVFTGPGTWVFSAAEKFPAIVELIGGGGGGGGGANAGQPGPTAGNGGGGGSAVFSGTPVGTVTANGGQGGRGGRGEVGGTPDSDRAGVPGTGGTADTSSATPAITFATTTTGTTSNGRPRGGPASSPASDVVGVTNRNNFTVIAGSAQGGNHGGGGNPGSQVGGGGGAGQGAYIRSNAFDLEGSTSYTFTLGGGGNGSPGTPNRGSGGSGEPSSAAIQVNFYDD